MAHPTPYLMLPGTARDALAFYAGVFGCSAESHTFAEFGRTDGPAEAIAHGYLTDGPVSLFAADVAGDEAPLRIEGLHFALLGTAPPGTMREWFVRLADGGEVVDDLQVRPWGASDGMLVDRWGVRWLLGFEAEGT